MLAMHPFNASVDMAAQQAYARLVATLGGGENSAMEVRRKRKRPCFVFSIAPCSPPPPVVARDRSGAFGFFGKKLTPQNPSPLNPNANKTQQGKQQQQQKQQRSTRPALSELSANTAATAVRIEGDSGGKAAAGSALAGFSVASVRAPPPLVAAAHSYSALHAPSRTTPAPTRRSTSAATAPRRARSAPARPVSLVWFEPVARRERNALSNGLF